MRLPVFAYLCRDVVCRWRENPLNLLAKIAIVAVLTGMAAVILISFHLSALELRRSLDEAGARSVIVDDYVLRERNAERSWVVDVVKPWHPLICHRMDRLPVLADTDIGASTPVFLLDADDPWFLEIARDNAAMVLFSDKFPEGTRVQVRLNDSHYTAVVESKPSWLGRLSSEAVLVAPREEFLPLLALGQESLTYLEVSGGRKNLETLVGALRALAAEAGLRSLSIRDPLTLLDRLDELESLQRTWKASIALGFGATLALVLGVVAFLEFREKRFVCALLKSFGLNPLIILARYTVDAVLVANGAMLVILGVVLWLAPLMLPSLGVSPVSIAFLDTTNFFKQDGLTLVVFVNFGTLLGMLPTAIGLGKPVGKVLA